MSNRTSYFENSYGSSLNAANGKVHGSSSSYIKNNTSLGRMQQTASLFKNESPLHAFLHSSNKLQHQSNSQSTFRESFTSTDSTQLSTPTTLSEQQLQQQQEQYHLPAAQPPVPAFDALSSNTQHTMSTLGSAADVDTGGMGGLDPIDINDDDSICSFDIADLEESNAQWRHVFDETPSIGSDEFDTPLVVRSLGSQQANASSTTSLNRAFENMYTGNNNNITTSTTVNAAQWDNITAQANMSCPTLGFSLSRPHQQQAQVLSFSRPHSGGRNATGTMSRHETGRHSDALSLQGNISCPSLNFDYDNQALSTPLSSGRRNSSVSSFNTMPPPAASSKKVFSSSRLHKKLSSCSSTSSMNGRRKNSKHELPGKNAGWSSNGSDPNTIQPKRKSTSSKPKRRSGGSSKSSTSGSKSSKERCMTYSGLILRRVDSKKKVLKDPSSYSAQSSSSDK